MDYLVALNTPYVDPVELAFLKEFGVEPKPPGRRLHFINRFLKAKSGGAGGGGGATNEEVT